MATTPAVGGAQIRREVVRKRSTKSREGRMREVPHASLCVSSLLRRNKEHDDLDFLDENAKQVVAARTQILTER